MLNLEELVEEQELSNQFKEKVYKEEGRNINLEEFHHLISIILIRRKVLHEEQGRNRPKDSRERKHF